jgi:hypothetical protein
VRGILVADRFTLFALRHCETGKTTHGTKYRNGEEYLDHASTSIAERLVKSHSKPDEFAASATTLRDCRTGHEHMRENTNEKHKMKNTKKGGPIHLTLP